MRLKLEIVPNISQSGYSSGGKVGDRLVGRVGLLGYLFPLCVVFSVWG